MPTAATTEPVIKQHPAATAPGGRQGPCRAGLVVKEETVTSTVNDHHPPTAVF